MSPILPYISSSLARALLPEPQLSLNVLEWVVRLKRPERGPDALLDRVRVQRWDEGWKVGFEEEKGS
jgi:hypothetical protein